MILDTSVIIAEERRGKTVGELLAGIRATVGSEPVALSTVSVMELDRGIWRAREAVRANQRQNFLDDLFAVIPTCPLTFEIARRAARIDGESRRNGLVIPFQDLIIGATALDLGYAVVTHNVRLFALIPDLAMKQL